MSVIGRLDKQVEEVIINPVGEKSSRRDKPATLSEESSERPVTAEEQDIAEEVKRPSTQQSPLPVWLL